MTRWSSRILMWAAVALASGSAALSAGPKRTQIDSVWRDHEITVDGSDKEWPGPLVRFGEQPVSIAAVNDGEFLYVVLTASDQKARMQILRQGLVVWFDNGGGEKKRFGIKYPVGGGFAEFGGRRGGGRLPDPQGTEGQSPDPALDRYEPPNRLELLGDNKDDERTYVADRAPGIEVKIGTVEGTLVYELKVPLARTDARPYAIGARPGAQIGVGIETLKIERPSGGGFGRGGGMGGRGGGGFGGGGRPRGGMDGRGFAELKPMKAWIAVRLAAR